MFDHDPVAVRVAGGSAAWLSTATGRSVASTGSPARCSTGSKGKRL